MSASRVGNAIISDDGLYRYGLSRTWGHALDSHALFIMLNPSVADAEQDDPTIRRCIGFAKREGCGGLKVVNLYAYISTNPDVLWTVDDPIGPDNDRYIETALGVAAAQGSPVIAAWGANATNLHRVYRVKQMPGMERAQALAFTKNGQPGHPLRLNSDAPLMPLVATGARS